MKSIIDILEESTRILGEDRVAYIDEALGEDRVLRIGLRDGLLVQLVCRKGVCSVRVSNHIGDSTRCLCAHGHCECSGSIKLDDRLYELVSRLAEEMQHDGYGERDRRA